MISLQLVQQQLHLYHTIYKYSHTNIAVLSSLVIRIPSNNNIFQTNLFVRWMNTSNSTTSTFDFHHNSSTTNNNEPCDVLQWAGKSENRNIALSYLQIPKRIDPLLRQQNTVIQTWDDYWTFRQWNFPLVTTNHTMLEQEYGQALVTHVMSAPLTLYTLLRNILAHRKTITGHNGTSPTTIRCCCIGARAEALIPIEYWEEMLFMIHLEHECIHHYHNNNNNNDRSTTTRPKLHIHFDFIGPEMNTRPDVSLHFKHTTTEPSNMTLDQDVLSTLTLRWLYKGLYHKFCREVIDGTISIENSHTNNNVYDVYILFNPGIGHPHLKQLWYPTLQLIMNHCINDNSIILLTAHSSFDAHRDQQVVQQYQKDFHMKGSNIATSQCQYIENPFASRIKYHDPISHSSNSNQLKPHIIRPNQYIAIFPELNVQ